MALPAVVGSIKFCLMLVRTTCKVEVLCECWEVAVHNSFSKVTVAWDVY